MVTKGFAAIYIAEMNLYCWQRNCCDRIPQSETGVRVSTGINNNSLVLPSGSMDSIDQGTFMVRLKSNNLGLQLLAFFFQ